MWINQNRFFSVKESIYFELNTVVNITTLSHLAEINVRQNRKYISSTETAINSQKKKE